MSEDRSDKFTLSPSGTVLTQCVYCRHRVDGPAQACAAFPGAIPDAILTNQVDHRRPYLVDGEPADRGIALERSITFEPRPEVPKAVLDRLYRTLDALHPSPHRP